MFDSNIVQTKSFRYLLKKKKSRDETLKDTLKLKKAKDFTVLYSRRTEGKEKKEKKKKQKSSISVQRWIYIRTYGQDRGDSDPHIIQ